MNRADIDTELYRRIAVQDGRLAPDSAGALKADARTAFHEAFSHFMLTGQNDKQACMAMAVAAVMLAYAVNDALS